MFRKVSEAGCFTGGMPFPSPNRQDQSTGRTETQKQLIRKLVVSIVGRQHEAQFLLECVSLGGHVLPETVEGDDQNGSVLQGGRISACSYRSYLSYDELAPDSLLDDRLSLVSGRTSTTPGPDVALVTPNGTLYRLSGASFHARFDPSNGRATNVVPNATHEDVPASNVPTPGGLGSVELDDVFVDEDPVTAVDENKMNYSSISVFDFAMACLRRQPPERTAVVSTAARLICKFLTIHASII